MGSRRYHTQSNELFLWSIYVLVNFRFLKPENGQKAQENKVVKGRNFSSFFLIVTPEIPTSLTLI
jgi:hypothetical protein